MLFFILILLGIFLLFCILAMLILLSSISIEVEQFYKENNKELQLRKPIVFRIKLLDKITIVKWKITKRKIDQLEKDKKIPHMDLETIEREHIFQKKNRDFIKNLKICLESLSLKIAIGTEDAVLTSYTVALLASAISILLPHIVCMKNKKKCYYTVLPKYENKNEYQIEFSSIIRIKIVHIIYSIYMHKKQVKGEEKNERTSNRRFNEYSHEFH